MYDEGAGVQQSTFEAVKWFQIAADLGDQASTYNLGLLHAQNVTSDPFNLVKSLNYFQQASSMGLKGSSTSTDGVTQAAIKAYQTISDSIAASSNINSDFLNKTFFAGSLNAIDTSVATLWDLGLSSLSLFNQSFVLSKGVINESTRSILRDGVNYWGGLIDSYQDQLSDLQQFLVLDNLQVAWISILCC